MSRGMRRLIASVFLALSASVLVSLPAHADERDIDSHSVTVTVQIDPLECTTGCGGGTVPGAELPPTGLASIEPLLWIAIALLVAGALFALRAQAARHDRQLSRSAAPSPYAVLSGGSAPASDDLPMRGRATRRETERGDGE